MTITVEKAENGFIVRQGFYSTVFLTLKDALDFIESVMKG